MRQEGDCKGFLEYVENLEPMAVNPFTGAIVKLRDSKGNITPSAKRVLKMCGYLKTERDEGIKCGAFRNSVMNGEIEGIHPVTGRKIKIYDSNGKMTTKAKNTLGDCGYTVPEIPEIIRDMQCRTFREQVDNGAVKAMNPFSGKQVTIKDSRGSLTSAAKKVLDQCGSRGMSIRVPSRRPTSPKAGRASPRASPREEFVEEDGNLRMSWGRNACSAFLKLIREGARQARNPRTGRIIKLVDSKGKIPAAAKKVMEECQTEFSL